MAGPPTAYFFLRASGWVGVVGQRVRSSVRLFVRSSVRSFVCRRFRRPRAGCYAGGVLRGRGATRAGCYAGPGIVLLRSAALIWTRFAAFCLDLGPFCSVLPRFGAVFLRSALIGCRFSPFCRDLVPFCFVLP